MTRRVETTERAHVCMDSRMSLLSKSTVDGLRILREWQAPHSHGKEIQTKRWAEPREGSKGQFLQACNL